MKKASLRVRSIAGHQPKVHRVPGSVRVVVKPSTLKARAGITR